MQALAEHHYCDLIGARWKLGGSDPDGIDCWEIQRLICARRGIEVPAVEVPADFTSDQAIRADDLPGWEPVREGDQVAGDVAAYMMTPEARQNAVIDHLGTLLPDGRILHAIESSGVVALRAGVWAENRVGWWRPGRHQRPEEVIIEEAGTIAGDRDSGRVVFRIFQNVVDLSNAQTRILDWTGGTIASYLPDIPSAEVMANVNGARVEDLDTHRPEAGDIVSVVYMAGFIGAAAAAALGLTNATAAAATAATAAAATAGTASAVAGTAAAAAAASTAAAAAATVTAAAATLTTAGQIVAFAINSVIALGLGAISRLLSTSPKVGTGGPAEVSPTFDLTRIRNSIAAGGTIPIVFGEHRVGGQIIALFNAIGSLESPPPALPNFPGSPFGPGQFVMPPQDTLVGGKTTLNMLIAVSEGEIQSINGLAEDMDDVPASSIPRGTLLINGNDAADYTDVSISVRMGKTTQRVIPGYNDVVVGVGVNQNLKFQQVWGTTTTTDVNAFEIQLFEPGGHYRIKSSNGAPARKRCDYTFRYRAVGATTWISSTIIRRYINRAPHSWTIRVNGPVGVRQKYEMEIERLTADDDDQVFLANGDTAEVSLASVNAVNEITYDAVAYGGKALISLKALATDQLSGVPTVTSLVQGKKLWVYDETLPGSTPDTPDFTFKYTQNPGEIVQGVMLNQVWGLGKEIDLRDIDYASLQELIDYCNETIGDGRGGFFERWSFNYVYDSGTKASDLVNLILAACRASIVPVGSKTGTFKIDRAQTPVHVLNEANLADVVIGRTDNSRRATRMDVTFANEELDFDFDTVSVEEENIDPRDYKAESVTILGITHPARAMRAGKYLLAQQALVNRQLEATSSVDTLLISAGDAFYLSHQDISTDNVGGRLVSAGSGVFTIDRAVTLAPATTYRVRVMTVGTGSRVSQERTISSAAGDYAAGDTLTIDTDWDVGDVPAKGNVYALGPTATYLTAFRLVEAPLQGDMTRQIQALKYDVGVFDDDPGTVPASTPRIHDPRLFPGPVENLRVREEARVMQSGDVRNVLVVTWTSPEDDFNQGDIYYRGVDDGDGAGRLGWTRAGRGQSGAFEFDIFGCEDALEISVVPVSPKGNSQHPAFGKKVTHVATGKLLPPPGVTGLEVEEFGDLLQFTWDEPSTKDVGHHEIRLGTNWLGAVDVVCVPNRACQVLVPAFAPESSVTYHAKAVTTSGVPSEASASAAYTHDIQTAVHHTANEHTAWAGTKTDMTVSSGELLSDTDATNPSYTTPQLDAASSQYSFVTINPDIRIEDRSAITWEDAGFMWQGAGGRARTWGSNELSDYPDSREDVLQTTWGNADFTWDSVIAKERQWDGLIDDFLAVTVESKAATTTGALSAAPFRKHRGRTVQQRYRQVRVSANLPADDYLVRIKTLTTTAYRATLSAFSPNFSDELTIFQPFAEVGASDTGSGTVADTAPAVTNPTVYASAIASYSWDDDAKEGNLVIWAVPDELDTDEVITAELIARISGTPGDGDKIQITWNFRANADNEDAEGAGATASGSVTKVITGYSDTDIVKVDLGTVFPASTLAAGDLVHGVISRNATSFNTPNDDFAGSIEGIGVRFKATRKGAT